MREMTINKKTIILASLTLIGVFSFFCLVLADTNDYEGVGTAPGGVRQPISQAGTGGGIATLPSPPGSVAAGGLCCQDDDCANSFTGACQCKHTCEKLAPATGLPESGTAGVCAPKNSAAVCPFSKYTDIDSLVKAIIDWVFYFSIIIAPLLILVGAFLFLTSAGEPKRTSQGKKIIQWAAIGLVVILFAKGFYGVIHSILVGG